MRFEKAASKTKLDRYRRILERASLTILRWNLTTIRTKVQDGFLKTKSRISSRRLLSEMRNVDRGSSKSSLTEQAKKDKQRRECKFVGDCALPWQRGSVAQFLGAETQTAFAGSSLVHAHGVNWERNFQFVRASANVMHLRRTVYTKRQKRLEVENSTILEFSRKNSGFFDWFPSHFYFGIKIRDSAPVFSVGVAIMTHLTQ